MKKCINKLIATSRFERIELEILGIAFTAYFISDGESVKAWVDFSCFRGRLSFLRIRVSIIREVKCLH